ncbi:hypothetical protein C8F04DRAFT_413985 [Mycena alexandri]|uniref:Fido domain-containing protein n=1 Tax=Mycena alexandri TaxID=1745969 RepID=A0AAD6X3E8_9AGAR|nr:hypothetical protein C8F04DRAFT_413985 [Mycena alexandri]
MQSLLLGDSNSKKILGCAAESARDRSSRLLFSVYSAINSKRMAASLLDILRITAPTKAWPHSTEEVELLSRHYGAQMTGIFPEFEDIVFGVLPTNHPARLLQLNQFVTSGLTPAGEINGYQPVFRQEIKAATNTSFTTGTGLYTNNSKQSIRTVIDTASTLALDIRTNQYFKDGNHRTCLLALVLFLAEHGVVLTSSFHVYRAYTIASARFHPGNESNTLNAAARADAHRRLVRYLRHRTIQGVATSKHLETLAETVRQLPIIVSHVEEVGARLQKRWEHKSHIWSTLNWGQKVVVKWTFPELNEGRMKLR